MPNVMAAALNTGQQLSYCFNQDEWLTAAVGLHSAVQSSHNRPPAYLSSVQSYQGLETD